MDIDINVDRVLVHTKAEISVENDSITLVKTHEDEDDGLELVLEGICDDSREELLNTIYNSIDDADDFVRALNGTNRRDLEGHFEYLHDEEHNDDLSADSIIERLDGDYREWGEIGEQLRDTVDQKLELRTLLEKIGLEKIKEVMDIKLCIMND